MKIISLIILFGLLLNCNGGKITKKYKWSDVGKWSKKATGSKVLIIYTGGTIGMLKGKNGLEPRKGYMGDVLRGMSEIQSETAVTYDIVELDPLLDSSSMSPSDWTRIGDVINAHYKNYDGFVVLHGTDTMQYTASALSFMFENLSKTIVVTGSQIPISEPYTDAKNNLISSLKVAAHLNVPEVVLVFGGLLLRGNRVTKTSANSLRGFSSVNYPALAKLDLRIELAKPFVLQQPKGPMVYHPVMSKDVAVLTLYPGITGKTVRSIVDSGVKGIVIQAFGEGNAPENKDFVSALQYADQKGIVLVDTTQCGNGNVNMDSYAAGSGLKAAHVVNGRDMTVSAAFTKMANLIGRGLKVSQIKELMEKDLCGEMSIPQKDEL
ncbi:L-asparaginase, putative [Entamoeba histolytica HM-1:IMSS-B]|uniref:asparaginase n=7 Tax=Entamoeba histolytica TaxID=5759 RepID=C4LTU4_ENTH1|nr:L-asparaginase, putative [Entamoeba histolytica HM-1:IMSS]EMD48996.1 L-asparaginase, putative [Entamoeba histolytica KU27]EMH74962.1 L-asparaginase, putative [Entamoeba histolytica HM-1:IMSS-B]EMS12433.1 L-asparaginase [Entamoeba histolytica HM-3:IMSS]ENY65098.1 L-asparaginase, putative [Entamoeba histolytica HM-1:IMSS-A]BAN38008.1 L-asparaginase, putative [Entamoeba histolytica]|eukprot:XP_656586.1 L-asparaginase, putative [Entamoeba histolytica HM-1:IMSS]